jgi:hypothetical protein
MRSPKGDCECRARPAGKRSIASLTTLTFGAPPLYQIDKGGVMVKTRYAFAPQLGFLRNPTSKGPLGETSAYRPAKVKLATLRFATL